MTLIDAPIGATGSGPDGRSVADGLALVARTPLEDAPTTGIEERITVSRRSRRESHPTRPAADHLFQQLAKEIGVDYKPLPRTEVRRAVEPPSTDCPACGKETELRHSDEMGPVKRHWFRCVRCKRWWALTTTFRYVSHGPNEDPKRLKDNR